MRINMVPHPCRLQLTESCKLYVNEATVRHTLFSMAIYVVSYGALQ